MVEKKSSVSSSTSSNIAKDEFKPGHPEGSNNNRASHQAEVHKSSNLPAAGTTQQQHHQRKEQAALSNITIADQERRPSEEHTQLHNLTAKPSVLPLNSPRSQLRHQPQRQQHPATPPTTPPTNQPPNMSKLSSTLKHLINAPFAKPSYTVINSHTLTPTITRLATEAKDHGVSPPAWLAFSTATAMTMNAPSAMLLLWSLAQKHAGPTLSPVATAELQREVGLKCISFNGIPRTINCLGAFYNSLPADIRSKLSRKPTRQFAPDNIEQRKSDGLGLWDSVYFGFERKLLDKLGQSHPDLPVHIIHAHYASLLSNPSRHTYVDGEEKPRETQVGRVLTSLVAIACLRAQTGVGPQVVSHVFGLRKAYERGDAEKEGEVEVPGGKWLSTEEGNKWLLEWIDELVKGVGTMQEGEAQQEQTSGGTTFAPGLDKAKL